MTGLLSNAGRAALTAFLAAVLVLAPGILNAPNENSAFLLALAALIAGIDAAFKVLQTFVPALKTPWPVLDSFIRAGLAAFFAFAPGIYFAPDLATARSAGIALMIGVANALVRAAQGLLTKSETISGLPAPAAASKTGFEVPDRVPSPNVV